MEILDFSTTQIWRENNFENSRTLKTTILAVSEALEFILGKFQPLEISKRITKIEFQNLKNVKIKDSHPN